MKRSGFSIENPDLFVVMGGKYRKKRRLGCFSVFKAGFVCISERKVWKISAEIELFFVGVVVI